MGALCVFIAKLRNLFGRRRDESEFDAEIRQHIELLIERYVASGMSAEEAAYAAQRQFGNRSALEEARREARTFTAMEALWRELRQAARQLRLNLGFTSAAVLCVGLGIGANAAVFTLLDQLVLRLLPVKQPERLVMIWGTGLPLGSEDGPRASSYPMYQDLAREAQAFDYVFCRFDEQVAMGFAGSTERVNGELVSGNFFQALGVSPTLGRLFSPAADDRIYKGHPTVVLSYRFWKNRFGADRSIVGQKILLNQYPMEVVGIAPAGFAGLDPSQSPELWIPIQMKPLMTPGQDDLGNRRANWVQIFARLKPGSSVAQARSSLQPLFHRILRHELETDTQLRTVSQYQRELFLKRTMAVQKAANGYSDMREQYSTALAMLMGMAGLILIVACANVASLLVARAGARRKEIAVRLAIGAGRKTLIRQILIEALLLSMGGVGLGLIFSTVVTRALLGIIPNSGSLLLHAEPDARILWFSVAVAVMTGALFGLAPAIQGTRLDVASALKDAASATAGSGSSAKLRKTLVAVQVALSFLLLAGASLFTRTLLNLEETRTGFRDIEHVATFQVDPAKLGYPPLRIRTFYEDVLREIGATSGVESVAYSVVPVFDSTWWGWSIVVEGHPVKDGESTLAHVNVISPGYWRTMGVPLLRGRDFNAEDRFDARNGAETPSVAIVNRKFAEHYFGNASPVGRHIGNGTNPGQNPKLSVRIIGEVEDSLYQGPRDGVPPQVFYAHPQAPVPLRAYFYVRTAGNPRALFGSFRRAVAKQDATMPVDDMEVLQTKLDDRLATERLIAFLSVVFGTLATVLAALGLYGVMAFVIARRTKELGLRMALGAPRATVLWMVLKETAIVAALGVAVGVPVAIALSRYASSELFGVKVTDFGTWCGSVVIVGVAAGFAALMPARRASSIDPIRALRYE